MNLMICYDILERFICLREWGGWAISSFFSIIVNGPNFL